MKSEKDVESGPNDLHNPINQKYFSLAKQPPLLKLISELRASAACPVPVEAQRIPLCSTATPKHAGGSHLTHFSVRHFSCLCGVVLCFSFLSLILISIIGRTDYKLFLWCRLKSILNIDCQHGHALFIALYVGCAYVTVPFFYYFF